MIRRPPRSTLIPNSISATLNKSLTFLCIYLYFWCCGKTLITRPSSYTPITSSFFQPLNFKLFTNMSWYSSWVFSSTTSPIVYNILHVLHRFESKSLCPKSKAYCSLALNSGRRLFRALPVLLLDRLWDLDLIRSLEVLHFLTLVSALRWNIGKYFNISFVGVFTGLSNNAIACDKILICYDFDWKKVDNNWLKWVQYLWRQTFIIRSKINNVWFMVYTVMQLFWSHIQFDDYLFSLLI